MVGGLASFGIATAGAVTPTPAITLTPSAHLANGEEITINGTGFQAEGDTNPVTPVAAVECNSGALALPADTQIEACNATAPVVIIPNADGTLPTTNFFVQTGAIGNGTCGTSSADETCFIAVGTESGVLLAYNTINFQGVTVTPSTALVGGQKVSVSGFGFSPNDSVNIVQCLATATTEAGCNIGGAVLGLTTDNSGNLAPTNFTIASGAIGNGTCSSSKNPNGCVIEVSNLANTDDAAAQIAFLPPRAIKVTPSKNLKNKQTIKVSGAGFTPGDHVYLVECLVGSTSPSKCDLKTLKAATIAADGTLKTTSFKVVTGKVGTGTCGTTKSNLKKCDISVANATKGDSKVMNITFALAKKK